MRSLRHMLALTLCVTFGTSSVPASAQQPTGSDDGIEIVAVPLPAWLASRKNALPGTLADFRVDPGQLDIFRVFVDALISSRWPEATKLAAVLKYRLVKIREGSNWIVIASDNGDTGRGPTIALHLNPSTEIIFEAPHVPFELGTAEQAGVLLSKLGARAALISGAHRCASLAVTACDGKTEVCGKSEPYRDSDVGHNNASLFHVAHVAFAEAWPATVVVSLHGMREDNDDIMTSIILSNGIRAPDSAKETPATKLRFSLADFNRADGAVASCNWPDDEKFKFRKLCGYTNVQGRHVNGDADVCSASMESGTGRFIHIEQDWSVLRRYSEEWAASDFDEKTQSFVDAFRSIGLAVIPSK